ncbi:MlaA family lipoprotein [Pseudoduganella chitinolytica]|uniref:VacJ family lipoprotein n=1 Tax=Pseudoduganella chitinolytica TaxID=34070 RepID=A0ABY8B8I5_9BURK|nr:VacJ family lipoprotein [Pseudoduganella chitinolytica]WEF32125.1 VacJ family lipoprotein [Pseudoduganella chitinolytica]
MSRKTSVLLALAATAALSGCAIGPDKRDPMENWNRAVFKFNDTVDTYALKPVATGYKNVTPGFVQTGVSNFFGNLSDVWTAANNLLQGKGADGMSDVMRVALNSTFGLLGVLDIASEAGLPKHKEDFGQTMGKWGVQSGPFVMLPLLGPSTLRDTVGLPLDMAADPWGYKEPVNVRNIGAVTRVVDQRAALLDAGSLFEDAALDRYEFLRDGYLQRRQSQVYDGDVPQQTDKEENVPDQPVVNPTGAGTGT